MAAERPPLRAARRGPVGLAAGLALASAGVALGHATLVFGTVTTEPAPPPSGAPFALLLEMRDPADVPVEDAVVSVEARHEDGRARAGSGELDEVAPGAYRTRLQLDEPGSWTLTFRDRTFRQEEAQASVTLEVGPDAATESVAFIFPPTATGPQSVITWLVWLVGLPLAAGAVVTVLVLRGGTRAADPPERAATAEGEPDGPGGREGGSDRA